MAINQANVNVGANTTRMEKQIEQAAQRIGRSLSIDIGTSSKDINKLSQPLGRITGQADEFTKSMSAANARVLAFGASVGVLNAVINAFKGLVSATIEVEASLANINTILNRNTQELDKFKASLFQTAKDTGQSFDTVAEAALELARQGLEATEVTKRLNDALILSRLSGLDAADAVSGLTAAINSFNNSGLQSADILNKISAASVSAAVSDRDLIEGLKRSGSVANTTGVEFDNLVGIIAALQEKTARGGAVIGNSLKTIFTRIQSLENLQTLQDLGVQVTDLQGDVLSADRIIQNLAGTFNDLSKTEQINLADQLVGKFQIAPFLALLADYNSEQVRSKEIAEASANATNEAYRRNLALNKTIASIINEISVGAKELASTLGEIGVTDSLKGILEFFANVIEKTQELAKGDSGISKVFQGFVKALGGIIAGPGLAIFVGIIGKLSVDLVKFGKDSLKTFFGLNSSAKELEAIQGRITSALLSNKDVQKQITSIESQNLSIEEKRVLQAQLFSKALNEQFATIQKAQSISASIAPAVLAQTQGASRRVARSASGYSPVSLESRDISRGVGGAPASAKPVIIPNFAFGNGQRGMMVANDSEYIVPNFANGGSAIFNQDMARKHGLPSTARKISAAGGFIPNFAATPRDIINKPGNYISGNGSFKSKAAEQAYLNASPEEKKLIDQQLQQRQKLSNSTLRIDASRLGIAALFSSKKTDSSKASLKTISHEYAQKLASQYKDIRFDNIQIGTLDSIKPSLTEASNRTSIGTFFAEPLARYGQSLIGGIFANDEFTKISKQIEDLGKRQGARIFSAAGEGAILESAINLATKGAEGISEFKSNSEDQVPFDFEEAGFASDAFKNAFGFPFPELLKKADAKRTATNDAVQSVIKKAFNADSELEEIKKQAIAQGFSAAGGYIPNFAQDALSNAIAREKAAGLPINQIRINQDSKLRNAQNPLGLAVTNTRDEPTGAIPNFARADAPAEASRAQAAPINEVTQASKDYLGVIFAAQAGLSGLTAATNESSSAIGKAANIFASSLSKGTTSLFAIQGIGEGLKGIGKEGSKLGGVLGKASGVLAGPWGLAISGAIAGFDLFKTGYNELTGVTSAAKLGLEKVAEAADRAAYKLSDFGAKDRQEISKRGTALLQGARKVVVDQRDIRGNITGNIAEIKVDFKGVGKELQNTLQESINAGLAGGADYTSIFNEVNAAAKSGLKITEDEVLTLIDTINLFGQQARQAKDNFLSSAEASQFSDFSESRLNKAFAGGYGNTDSGIIRNLRERLQSGEFGAIISDPQVQEKLIRELWSKYSSAGKQAADEIAQVMKQITGRQAQIELEKAFATAESSLNKPSELENSLKEAQALNALTKQGLRDLELRVQKEGVLTEQAKENLQLLGSQVDLAKQLNADEDKIADVKKRISELTREDLLNEGKLTTIAEDLFSTTKGTKEQRDRAVEAFVAELQKLDLIKEGEIDVLRILKEQSDTLDGKLDTQKEYYNNLQRTAELEKARSSASVDKELLEIERKRFDLSQKRAAIESDVFKTAVEKAREVYALEQQAISLDLAEGEQNYKMSLLEAEVDLRIKLLNLVKEANIEDKDRERLNELYDPENLQAFAQATKELEDSLGREVQAEIERYGLSVEKSANNFKFASEKAHELNKTIKLGEAARKKDAGFAGGFLEGLVDIKNEVDSFEYDLGKSIPQQFADGLNTAIGEAVTGAKSLKDALSDAALSFLQTLQKAFINNAVNSLVWSVLGGATGGGNGFFGVQQKASGGRITGGSGVRDDVPALLMGGEYVMNKKAVQKYGPQFMESLNSGNIPKFAKGGYFIPGTYGQKAIKGKRNLLGFAAQSYTAGQNDVYAGGSDYAAINLEPESVRLTTFGRNFGSPLQRATEEAKNQAFGLYVQQSNRDKELALAEKERKDALKKQITSTLISAAVSYGLKVGTSGYQAGVNEVLANNPNATFGEKLSGGLKGIFTGGNIEGVNVGGFANLFSAKGTIGSPQQLAAYAYANPNSDIAKQFYGFLDSGGAPKAFAVNPANIGSSGYGNGGFRLPTQNLNQALLSNINTSNFVTPADTEALDAALIFAKEEIPYFDLLSKRMQDKIQRDYYDQIFGLGVLPPKATGGPIPPSAGVDTYSARLSGGEFVMNQASTQKIGAGNLQALNAGADSLVTEDKSEELNQKIVDKLDELIEKSSNAGNIEINIDSSGKETSSQQSSDETQQNLARRIKEVVLRVIEEEKRLGGTLRRGLA